MVQESTIKDMLIFATLFDVSNNLTNSTRGALDVVKRIEAAFNFKVFSDIERQLTPAGAEVLEIAREIRNAYGKMSEIGIQELQKSELVDA